MECSSAIIQRYQIVGEAMNFAVRNCLDRFARTLRISNEPEGVVRIQIAQAGQWTKPPRPPAYLDTTPTPKNETFYLPGSFTTTSNLIADNSRILFMQTTETSPPLLCWQTIQISSDERVCCGAMGRGRKRGHLTHRDYLQITESICKRYRTLQVPVVAPTWYRYNMIDLKKAHRL